MPRTSTRPYRTCPSVPGPGINAGYHSVRSYCRYCTREPVSSESQQHKSTPHEFDMQIDYLKNTPQVRDVLLSGGDPLVWRPRSSREILTRLPHRRSVPRHRRDLRPGRHPRQRLDPQLRGRLRLHQRRQLQRQQPVHRRRLRRRGLRAHQRAERDRLHRRQPLHADRHLPDGDLHGREPGGLRGERSVPRRGHVQHGDGHLLEPERSRTARRATTATPARRRRPARPAPARARTRWSARRATSATSRGRATR